MVPIISMNCLHLFFFLNPLVWGTQSSMTTSFMCSSHCRQIWTFTVDVSQSNESYARKLRVPTNYVHLPY